MTQTDIAIEACFNLAKEKLDKTSEFMQGLILGQYSCLYLFQEKSNEELDKIKNELELMLGIK
jgi:hypothetical protein